MDEEFEGGFADASKEGLNFVYGSGDGCGRRIDEEGVGIKGYGEVYTINESYATGTRAGT